MGLSDALAKAKQDSRGGTTCGVCKIIATLDKDDAAALDAAMADKSIFASTIVRALAAEGHKVTSGTLQRHRRGGCVPR